MEQKKMELGKITVKQIIDAINMYTFFQILWAVEHIFLSLNAVLQCFPNFAKQFFEVMPAIIKSGNEKILDLFEQYYTAVFTFTALLLAAGILMIFYCLSYFGRYDIIRKLMGFPLYCAIWLCLISIAYLIYISNPLTYLTLPLFLFVVELGCISSSEQISAKDALELLLYRLS